MADELPTIITTAGLLPTPPATISADLLARVAAVRPGYTATIPGILIEDIASTDVAAIVECDSARVETVNSLTPLGANAFTLVQLGAMLGVPIGVGTNTSVLVVFTGLPGFVIAQGFIVSDGSHQYVIQTGGIIGTDGTSDSLYALASATGSWAIPANTVTQLVTPPPTGVSLSVTNPEAGLPGVGEETETSYRARVLQANLAASQGMARYLKTLVGNVDGVQARLISVQTRDDGKWTVLVGGGDPYKVAYAIWTALFDVNNIVGSELLVSNITSAAPAQLTTFLNHGYVADDDFTIGGVNPSGYDGDFAVIEVVNEKKFTYGTRFAANALTAQSWSTGKVTFVTATNHGVSIGSTFTIANSSPAGYNGTFVAIMGTATGTLVAALVSDPGSSTVLGGLLAGIANFDASALTYVSGGVLTPNPRNVDASVNDWPDTYVINWISPPQQTVSMSVTWNTTSTNVVSEAAVAQLAAPAIVDYVNGIFAGQPINVDTVAETFRLAVASVLPPELVTRLVIAVSINGVSTPVTAGTVIVEGDPESYFYAVASDIDVVKG